MLGPRSAFGTLRGSRELGSRTVCWDQTQWSEKWSETGPVGWGQEREGHGRTQPRSVWASGCRRSMHCSGETVDGIGLGAARTSVSDTRVGGPGNSQAAMGRRSWASAAGIQGAATVRAGPKSPGLSVPSPVTMASELPGEGGGRCEQQGLRSPVFRGLVLKGHPCETLRRGTCEGGDEQVRWPPGSPFKTSVRPVTTT